MGKTSIKMQGMLHVPQTCAIRGMCSTGLILHSGYQHCLTTSTFLKLSAECSQKFSVIIFRHRVMSLFATLGLILKFHSDYVLVHWHVCIKYVCHCLPCWSSWLCRSYAFIYLIYASLPSEFSFLLVVGIVGCNYLKPLNSPIYSPEHCCDCPDSRTSSQPAPWHSFNLYQNNIFPGNTWVCIRESAGQGLFLKMI